MNIQYILNLYKQYCNRVGKIYIKSNAVIDNEFIAWFSTLKKETEIFSDYLTFLSVNLSNEFVIELDKGKYDTVGVEKVSLVSKYADTLNIKNGELLVNNGCPFIIMDSSIYSVDNSILYLSHNPFFSKESEKIASLHNSGSNICFGIHGEISDKDKILKLKKLQEISEKMTSDLKFYYDTLDDNYFACIISNRKVRKKILIK